jgi:spore maturation protein CgeB
VIRYYLAHPGERERITTAAHRFVTEELTWEKTMDRVVAVIRRAIEDRSNRGL